MGFRATCHANQNDTYACAVSQICGKHLQMKKMESLICIESTAFFI